MSAQHPTEYPPPVLRAPSPASSVGTAYGVDQTSFSDTEDQIGQTAFEKKWEDRIGLWRPSKEEELANQGPLLYPPPTNAQEERAMYERVMRSLRAEVRKLEENELFEQTILRGSQVALAQQPVSNDIDTLMRSMMGPSRLPTQALGYDANSDIRVNANLTNGPWNVHDQKSMYEDGEGRDLSQGSGATVGKRSAKGKARSHKN